MSSGPAVLAWGVAGLREFQEVGLRPPPAVRAATAAWRAENDPIADWLDERTKADQKAKTPFADLNRDYRAWAEGLGLRPISAKKLAKRLQDRGFTPDTGEDRKRSRVYCGLRLLSNTGNDGNDKGHFPESPL